MSDATIINQPWIIVYQADDGKMITGLHPPESADYEQYGLLIADVIRHVARMYDVDEFDVFRWVEKEIDKPTTKIEGGRVQ